MPIDQMLAALVEREGGYSDHPADKGGPTKYGITQSTLSSWRNAPASVDDVKNLTVQEAEDIYRKQYLTAPGLINIRSAALLEQVFDAAVNHGVKRSIDFLQQALGVTINGVLDAKTLAAIASANRDVIFLKFIAIRLSYFSKILTNNPKQDVFAAGWLNRCASMVDQYEHECQQEVATSNTPSTILFCQMLASQIRGSAFAITSHASNPAEGVQFFENATAKIATELKSLTVLS